MTSSALTRGAVVLIRFPFTDLTGTALRPAVIVSPGPIGRDLVLMAISSVVRGTLAPTDCVVDTTHPEFAQTGLRVTSAIRIHKLTTVESSVIVRRLGSLGPRLQAEVDRGLLVVLGLQDP